MKNNKIFVYGTLKRGYYNERFIPNETISKMWYGGTNASLYTIKGASYPALIDVNSGNLVMGELYEIKDEFLDDVIDACDHLEGHPYFYRREIIDVIDENGEKHKAYTYIFVQKHLVDKLIRSGIFA